MAVTWKSEVRSSKCERTAVRWVSVRRVTRSFPLLPSGFAVGSAADGFDALRKANSMSPDLIVLDLMLPELDGFAVCEILRHHPATASTPIIMLTALSGELARLSGLDSGANEFV